MLSLALLIFLTTGNLFTVESNDLTMSLADVVVNPHAATPVPNNPILAEMKQHSYPCRKPGKG